MKKATVAILSLLGYAGVRHIFKREMLLQAYRRYDKVNRQVNAPALTSTKALTVMLVDIRTNKKNHTDRLLKAGFLKDPRKLLDYFEWEYRSHLNVMMKENTND